MRPFSPILLLCCGLFALMSGCKQANPTPEVLDPIYNDLLSIQKATDGAIAAQEKKIEAAKKELPGIAPRDPYKKQKISEIYKLERELTGLKEQSLYYEIRAKQRKQFARTEYLKAFNADKPWPDPSEYENYKKTRELRTASRKWDDRVPKLQVPGTNAAASAGKPKESGEKKAAAH